MIDYSLLLVGLRELSNKALQRKLWLFEDERYTSSFEEAVSTIFDDAKLSLAIEKGFLSKNFSKDLNQKVSELNKLVRQVNKNLSGIDYEELIEHPMLEKIRGVSDELIDFFCLEMI